jgi:K+-sensing histidine kinase KdpD
MEKQHIESALLQVLSHDLLAPITAIKWQGELLAKNTKDMQKQKKYIDGIQESAGISIALLQYVGNTASVLRGEKVGERVLTNISEVLQGAWKNVEPQYARHGVSLDCHFDMVEKKDEYDVHMLQVLVWVIAKFFLSSAVAQQTVVVRGFSPTEEVSGLGAYTMTVSAEKIAHAENYAQMLTDPNVA